MHTRTEELKGQRGVALLLTLFALVILTVIGLGMMSATDMETSVNSNYKQKQAVFYSLESGMQEARDRIQPATHDITPPTALPLLSAGNVIYIINPKTGDTVAPWSSSNKYKDTELCQEKVLGLSGTPGVPCTTLPSGSLWYTSVDDSNSSSAPWNTVAAGLDTKWTRITLKANNMTPNPVNGNSADSTLVCWDGSHQIAIPGGYGSNCTPNGSVASVQLNSAGTGYTSAPTVTIAAPPGGGTQATATANLTAISNGQVASVNVTANGFYTTAPTITFSGGGGTGAAATAVWSAPGSSVTSISLTSNGTECYAVAPAVAITGGGGNGATATSALSGTKSCITSWNPSAHCTSLKNQTVPNVSLGGPGASFSGTLVFDNGGHIGSSTIQQAGTSYTSAPATASSATLTAAGCVVTPNTTVGYTVQSVALTAGGNGYTSAPGVSFGTGAGTSGTTAAATTTIGAPAGNGGQVTAINVTASGSGYTTPPSILIGDGTGGAAATAVLGTTNNVTGISLTNAGSGYTSNPTVTLSGGGGSGATASAYLATGANYGKVYLITTLAQSKTGARAMSQMEVASPVTGFNFTGGIILAGPNPTINSMPNSNNFVVDGHDANSCGKDAKPAVSAIGGFDDPNANPPTHSVSTIISAIPSGRTDHYTGSGNSPSVSNVFGALGETMTVPTGYKALLDAVMAAPGANVYNSNPSVSYGTSSAPVVDYVDGDLTLNGNGSGYGVLAVTGTLTMSGNFSWHGIVFVFGNGAVNFNGGGNGQIVGSIWVAKIWDDYSTKNLLSSMGTPSFGWNGGGGNGVQYDHCWADDLMARVPFTPPPSTAPLKILGIRTLSY